MGKLRWIRSINSKTLWILACVLLFGFTGQVAAAEVFESLLMYDGSKVGSCVAVWDRMDAGENELEMVCGHDLDETTVVVSLWKRSEHGLILVGYVGPKGNPFDVKVTLGDADVDELLLGNMIVSVAPTSREAQPVLGQLGIMDTGYDWSIMEDRAHHMDGWCASTLGRMDERYEIVCMTPNNPDGGSVMVDSTVAFDLMGTTTLWASIEPHELAEPCTDDVDWMEFHEALMAGEASVEVGAVGNDIPKPMKVVDFATFAAGQGIGTEVVVMNRHTTTELSGSWIVRNQQGYPLLGDEFGPLAPLAKMVESTPSDGADLIIGTTTVKAEGALGGVLRYSVPGGGVAGVLSSSPQRQVIVPATNGAAFSTGIAIRNPESHDVTYEIRVIAPADSRTAIDDYIAIGEVTLPPAGQVSKFVSELAECEAAGCLDDYTGTVVITGKNGAVEAVAFEFGTARFTVVPVAPVEGP